MSKCINVWTLGGREDVCEMDGHSLKISLWTKYR